MYETPDIHLPRLYSLPETLPADNAVRLELVEGMPILRASDAVRRRIELLLETERQQGLTKTQETELEQYAEIDDYLSLLNRIVRNALTSERAQPDEV